MNSELLKCGTFSLFFGELGRKHFELFPIWCEYYQSSDLDGLKVPTNWIESNLFQRLNNSSDRAYYSSPDINDYTKIEFLNISCELKLGEGNFEGYLYLIGGEINSVSIFLDEELVDFYSSDILFDDNVAALKKIRGSSGIDTKGFNSLEYFIKYSVVSDFIGTPGKFSFPIK